MLAKHLKRVKEEALPSLFLFLFHFSLFSSKPGPQAFFQVRGKASDPMVSTLLS